MTTGGWQRTEVAPTDWSAVSRRLAARRPVTVVIPVYNGGDVVRDCVTSVLRNTVGARIVLIDDASTDTTTLELLDEVEAAGQAEVVHHEENWGYTRTANHALALGHDSDVVLLNSDTVVGPNWLVRLTVTAYSRDDVATVSAVSDNAGAMSLPTPGVANDWPAHLTWSESSRFMAREMSVLSQVIPTAHGFCMYVRRDAIDVIGGFDEAGFPRGYGEENDLSRRAVAAGLVNLLAPHVLVKHVRSVSFGSSVRAELVEAGVSEVVRRYPDYQELVHGWMRDAETRATRAESARILDRATAHDRIEPRVLYVLHRAGGGTPQTNLDLMRSLPEQENYLLEAVSGHSVVLSRVVDGTPEVLETWRPEQPFRIGDEWREDYAEFLVRVLTELNIELVHVRHLINQPLTTLPDVLALMHVPLVLSTHDFYYVCPTVQLIDDQGKHCGGVCTPGIGSCRLPTPFVQGVPSVLKHGWIHTWRERAERVFASAQVVVATTESAAAMYRKIFPAVAPKLILVEHGRELEVRTRPRVRKPGPVRVLAAAQWDPHKGVDYVRDLAREFGDEIEWHILGVRGEQLADVGIVHGAYRRDDFPVLADEIDPDLIAVLATWPETYSHTLTEAWSLGVPVIGNDIGAVADRIRKHGGGIVLPFESSPASFTMLRKVLDDGLESVPGVSQAGIRSVETMAEDYRTRVYRNPRVPAAPAIGVIATPTRASTYVRTSLVGKAADQLGMGTVRDIVLRDLLSGADDTAYSAILVQRDAVPADSVDDVIDAAKRRGARLVVELDDDLVTTEARERLLASGNYSAAQLDALSQLISSADQIIVSTDPLAELLTSTGKASLVTVFENRLSPRLWTSSVPTTPRHRVKRPVYVGTVTHAGDLELIEGLPELLSQRLGQETRIDVVGVTRGTLPPGFDRIAVPEGRYPAFVRWLRTQRSDWSVGLAPLGVSSINETKSDLKLLEYTALGLPSVASRRGPYEASGVPAHLVGDDIAGWLDGVAGLMTDTERSTVLLDRAQLVLGERVLDEGAVRRWVRLVLGNTEIG